MPLLLLEIRQFRPIELLAAERHEGELRMPYGYHIHGLERHGTGWLFAVDGDDVGLGQVGNKQEGAVDGIIADIGLLLPRNGLIPEIDRDALSAGAPERIVAL